MPSEIATPVEPTSVLLVRHTDVHNPANIVYGRMPRFRLSALGLAQAERTADYLSTQSLTAIYASPQLRARQTADIIARRHPGLSPRVTSRLAEIRTHWQGEPFTIVDALNPYEPLRDASDETMADVFGRMSAALRQAAARHAGGTIVCVSHADPIAILRIGVLGLDLNLENLRSPGYPTKGSITRFDFAPGEFAPRVSFVDINGAFNALPDLNAAAEPAADGIALVASGARS